MKYAEPVLQIYIRELSCYSNEIPNSMLFFDLKFELYFPRLNMGELKL